MTELRKCPFCGNEPTIIVRKGKDGWRDRYSVLCDYEHGGSGAESGWYHYEAEAVESWNRRVPPTTKQIEEYIEKTHKENTELVAKLKRKCDVKKMTNEEWFCQLPTGEKAEFFANIFPKSVGEALIKISNGDKERWAEWLKKPHTNE